MSSVSVSLPGRAAPGFGPQWWSSGTRTPRWWAAAALAVGVVAAYATFDLRDGSLPAGVAINVAGSIAELVVGLLFWMWRRNAIGPLIVTYVVLQPLGDIVAIFPQSKLAGTIGAFGTWLFWGFWCWMLLAFPSGRIWNRASAFVVVWGTLWVTLTWLPNELFELPGTYLYVGHGWSGLEAWDRSKGAIAIVAWLPFAIFLIARVKRAGPGARRRLVPLYALAPAVLFLVDVPLFAYCFLTAKSFVGGIATNFPAWWLSYGGQHGVIFMLSAIGAAFGLARVRKARGSVADLVVELGKVEPGHVRDTLARSLGDPTLVLGLWLPERGVWVDEQGQALVIPAGDERGVTYVGDRLAVMVHDRDLLDQPRLLEAVGSAGRLALENERLQAELRAQLRELQDSRARIVRTADEERRRLERDLHDGAQQRLLGLGMALQLLEPHVRGDGRELLSETEDELRQALAELRELARGIHPAVLTDQGLDAAVRTLAARAPVPVQIESDGERLPAHVETAAYFVVAEALANVSKYAGAHHAWVKLARENGCVRVEVRDDGVGGAQPGRGSGLTGLADRVGALGGRLHVESPRGAGTTVLAEIPYAS